MKTEINSENKARFFALYWGQEVLQDYGRKGNVNTYTIEYLDGDRSNQWIILKPLSKISDEDAVEVAKIMAASSSVYFAYEKTEWGVDRKNATGRQVWVYEKNKSNNNSIAVCYINFSGSVYFNTENGVRLFTDDLSVYDYLRSRGYALPWMGISVEKQIEAGWVKLEEL